MASVLDVDTGRNTPLPEGAWRLGYFDSREMPEYLLMRSNLTRFKVFQEQHSAQLKRHFYIIVVPNTLDLLDYCISFLPKNLNLFLILNGVRKWENDFIEASYASIPKFPLQTGGRVIWYDRVLDMLAEGNDSNFGVLDQDCFVMDETVIQSLDVAKNELVVSAFTSLNKKAGIEFPRTYLVYFNFVLLKDTRETYQLSFKRCWTIPPRIEGKLQALGFGYGNFPHNSLQYFDTFQLIWGTAFSDGFSFKRMHKRRLWRRNRRRFVHVGAGADYLTEEFRDQMLASLRNYERLPQLEQERLRAGAFSHYAHLLLLEGMASNELTERYLPFFRVYENSQDILRRFHAVMKASKIEEIGAVVAEVLRRRRRGRLGMRA